MALKEKQLTLIEAILANPTATDIELGKMLDVSRNTIKRWKDKEEWKAAFKQRLQEVWQDGEAIAVKSMLKLAANGSYQASAYILDNMGYKATTKIEADVNTDIVINIEE